MALYDLGPSPKVTYKDDTGLTGYEQSATQDPAPQTPAQTPAPTTGGTFGSGAGGAATSPDLQRWNQELYGGALTDLSPWLGQTDAYKNLSGTPQAQAYAQSQQTPAPSVASGQDWSKVTNWDANTVNQYFQSRGVTPNGTSAQYWADKWNEWGSKDPAYFFQRLSTADEFGGGGGSAGSGAAGGGVFSDPATAEWEKALRGLTDKLNQPYQAPGFDPLIKYLQDYATKLQGPAYTPQEMDTLQTQALDPLTSQRDAMRQQILQRAAARGLNPDSGIVQDEINQLDRSLSQQRSQRQGQFAANAVGLDRQNQQMAAQILAQIPALQAQQFQGNENRALQGLGLLGQIPQYADRRLQLALQSLGGNQSSPTALLGQLSSFQGQGMAQQGQDSDFWNQIGKALMTLFSGQ